MDKPVIKKENVKALLETKFIKVYDLQYAEGKHYFDATRNDVDNIVAIKSDDEFKNMLPDAVTCIVIVKTPNESPKLLLTYEYRYPTGRFLLSPPAGLIDKEDKSASNPLIEAAKREIFEETGIKYNDDDKFIIVSPLSFSTPGMTDESNALVCLVTNQKDLSSLNQEGAVGSECFDGFKLIDYNQAKQLLKNGRDEYGNYFSIYTWAALSYFISNDWN